MGTSEDNTHYFRDEAAASEVYRAQRERRDRKNFLFERLSRRALILCFIGINVLVWAILAMLFFNRT